MTTSADRRDGPSASHGRGVTPSRIVALLLVALVVLALGYVRFAPDDGAVTVPAGAQAGDLLLEPCEVATEGGRAASDCGTLVVPENRADPQSRLIALPVKRIRATSDEPAEPIFRLEGGPGITNMEFAAASRFTDRHDVVLVGYRGVDGSVRLDCPEVESALARSTDFLAETSFRATGEAFRACAERLTAQGIDLAGYGLPHQVEDLEAARVALGYERIDLVSESAGTRTALIYAWQHPQRVHRSVLIGANPPGHFLWDPATTDEQIGRYAARCAEDMGCSARTDDLQATFAETAAEVPDDWFFLPINEGTVRVLTFYGLMESTAEAAPLSAPLTLDAWLSAAEGDPSGLWLQSLAGKVIPIPFVWGQYAAAASLDAEAARTYFASETDRESVAWAGSAFAWAGGQLADAWPAAPDAAAYGRMRTSNVETLVVGGELDTTTPPQVAARELLPSLPRGRQVVLPGFGHTLTFWHEQPEAGTRLVTAFLERGRVDVSLYEPQGVDFTPSVPLTTVARITAGSMAGLALLAVLSLLWMTRRVHWAGRFGRTSSALLRWVWAPVIGIGSWLVGVLALLRTMPGVPLDHALLVTSTVGVPVALGVYLAWVHREWTAPTRRTGLAAAVSGALAGAWLGLHATTGVVGVLTAVAGAVAGANLALVLLDVRWDRAVRDRRGDARPRVSQPASLEPTAGMRG